tara:strand:+ start:4542 stop:4814 length:273 start_codon:yes stop_codon:yes gene_type:complete
MYWLFALSVFITLGMALMLYRHFNFLFETQYQMTQELIVLLKEKLQEPRNQTGREIEDEESFRDTLSYAPVTDEAKDWLYGVNYNLESEE